MREIKFRVWDKTRRRWAGFTDFSGQLHCDRDALPWVWSLTNKESNIFWDFQQYSGQNDKNGKTAAAGDIVDFEYGLGVVFWDEMTSCFKIRFDTDNDDLWLYCPDVNNSLEIIGNIYDNRGLVPAWGVDLLEAQFPLHPVSPGCKLRQRMNDGN